MSGRIKLRPIQRSVASESSFKRVCVSAEMAMIPPISPAIPTPIQGQPQGFAADKAEGDTKRVTGASEGATSGRSRNSTNEDGDARQRSDRSGQFSNTGTQGTRGGDAGMLSEGTQTKADGTREGRQDRTAERAQQTNVPAPSGSVRGSAEASTRREQAVAARMLELRPSAQNIELAKPSSAPVTDKEKVERFVERLSEVRDAELKSVAPADPVEASDQDSGDVSTQYEAEGRYDKRA